MIALGIQIDGGEEILADVRRLEANVKDLNAAGAWQAASAVISDEMEKLFAQEGAVDGAPRWSRLAPRTVKARIRRKLTPIRVGWATGRMATSLIEPTAAGAIEIRRAQEFIRGTAVANRNTSYPSIFESGRSAQPPRPIMGRLFRSANSRIVSRLMDAIEAAIFSGLDRK